MKRSRVSLRDQLRTGAIGLSSRRVRTLLSALGVAIGVATVVSVLGISRSSQADLLDQLDALGTNLLQVQAGAGMGFGGNTDLPDTAATQVRQHRPGRGRGHVHRPDRAGAAQRAADPR